MVEKHIQKNPRQQYALAFFCFFLVITLLSVTIVMPQIERTLERQASTESRLTLQTEAEILKRYIDSLRTNLEDLAGYPSITGAVLLSRSDNTNFTDLVDNHSISGKKSSLIIQNIAGDIIYQSREDLICSYSAKNLRAIEILENGASSHLTLHSPIG